MVYKLNPISKISFGENLKIVRSIFSALKSINLLPSGKNYF